MFDEMLDYQTTSDVALQHSRMFSGPNWTHAVKQFALEMDVVINDTLHPMRMNQYDYLDRFTRYWQKRSI